MPGTMELNSFRRVNSTHRKNALPTIITLDGRHPKGSNGRIESLDGDRVQPRRPEVPLPHLRDAPSKWEVRKRRFKFPICLLVMQIIVIILYGLFVDYPDDANTRIFAKIDRERLALLLPNGSRQAPDTDAAAADEELVKQYPNQDTVNVYGAVFQDSQFFLITGLTLLFAGLRQTGLSTMTTSFMIFIFCLEWSFVLYGLVRLDGYAKPNPRVFVLAVYFAEASMIVFGFVLGRCSNLQMLVVCVLEMAVCVSNDYLCADLLKVNDPGGVLTFNLFGTYFGISVQKMLYKPSHHKQDEKKTYSTLSEILAFVGSSILWVYWPTAMGSIFVDGRRHRSLLNTYYALIGSGIAAIAFSPLLNPEGKFTASHIQNAVLAGGVSMSGSADAMMGCYAALIVGCCAGMVSVFTYTYVQPFFTSKLGIIDTCGSHGLHGTPAFLGSVTSMVVAYLATEEIYGASLYYLYPARAPLNNTVELARVQALWPDIPAGENRSASGQALYHLAALGITFSVAASSGLVTGFLIKHKIFDPPDEDSFYDDSPNWHLPSEDDPTQPTYDMFTMSADSSQPPTQHGSRVDLIGQEIKFGVNGSARSANYEIRY